MQRNQIIAMVIGLLLGAAAFGPVGYMVASSQEKQKLATAVADAQSRSEQLELRATELDTRESAAHERDAALTRRGATLDEREAQLDESHESRRKALEADFDERVRTADERRAEEREAEQRRLTLRDEELDERERQLQARDNTLKDLEGRLADASGGDLEAFAAVSARNQQLVGELREANSQVEELVLRVDSLSEKESRLAAELAAAHVSLADKSDDSKKNQTVRAGFAELMLLSGPSALVEMMSEAERDLLESQARAAGVQIQFGDQAAGKKLGDTIARTLDRLASDEVGQKFNGVTGGSGRYRWFQNTVRATELVSESGTSIETEPVRQQLEAQLKLKLILYFSQLAQR